MHQYFRKVQYHETDKMGITHHANYIKWMEEARISFLESIGLPFQLIESKGIASPVAGLSVEYKSPSTFGDMIAVEVALTKCSGARLEVGYTMRNAETARIVAEAVSRHCFLKDGRIISLKRTEPEIYNILKASLENDQTV